MEKKTPPRKGWLRAASLAKGAARLSYAGAILGGLFTLRYQQSEAAPSYTILSGQMRGLLSQLFFLFLLLLPLMAAVLSGDLLAAYCRMRGGNRPGLLPRRVSRQPGGLDGAAAPGRQSAAFLPDGAAGLRTADAAGPGAGHTPAHGGHLAGLLASVRGRRGAAGARSAHIPGAGAFGPLPQGWFV